MNMPKSETSHLAKTLRRVLREKYDDNMSDMARAIGVAPSTVLRWMDSGMAPNTSTVSKICTGLGIAPSELLGDEAPASQRRGVISARVVDEAQAAAVDWLISRGRDADSVAMAAAIVARQVPPRREAPTAVVGLAN